MDKKITQLNAYTTPQPTDVSPIVDVGAGETKKITFANIALNILTYIQNSLGGLVQSVTGLNTDNTDPANPVIQISVDGTTITGDGTPGNPLIATGGGSGGGGSSGKTKSYSLEGLLGTPIQNGYQNIESYITSNGTVVYAELDPDFLQVYDTVADWASADQINSYVVNQGFLFLLLEDTGTNTYRVYRYVIGNLAGGGTLMTIATQTFGTQDFMMMTSDGSDFFFNYQAGNSANDYDISKYTISGTTLTWSSDTSCGAIAHATDAFIVDSLGHYYGLNTTGTREVKDFDSSGALQNTYGAYDSNYTNIINWDDSIYIAKSVGDDEAYRITTSTTSDGAFINPSRTSELFDEFMGGLDGTAGIVTGDHAWVVSTNGSVAKQAGLANHPGIVRLAGHVSGNGGGLVLATTGTPTTFGPSDQPSITVEYLVKLGNAGNFTLVGFTEALTASDYTTNGGKLAFVSNSNIWQGYYVNQSGGSIVTSSGTVATTTNWVKLKIVTDGTGANATFFVDGVSIGTVAIVAGSAKAPCIGIIGNTTTIDADYFHLFQRLTR